MAAQRRAIYLTAFTVVAGYFLVWPLWRAQFPLEIWPTEGWNAYFQDAAARWSSVYPGPDSLISNNYPPLSFYAIGQLANLLGDALYVGRALSVLALLAVGIEIALAVVKLGGDRVHGAIGGLWFVAIMAHGSTDYVGADDPQLAGQAIMGAALVWFIARERAGRSCLAPLLLMVCAGFWKHNIVAIPLTAGLWLLFRRSWRAIDCIALAIVAAAVGLGACGLVFGADVFANLLAPRAYGLWRVVPHLGHLQWLVAALLVWAIWSWPARKTAAARFTALHIGVSLVVCLAQRTGDGVAQNAEFDLIIALGIAVGVALGDIGVTAAARRFGSDRSRDALVMVLLLRLVVSTRQESAWVLFHPDFRAAFHTATAVVAMEASRAAAVPGPLYCDNKIICRLAGKPFAVDEFKLEQMVAIGAATPEQVARLLGSRGIARFSSDQRTFAYSVTQMALRRIAPR